VPWIWSCEFIEFACCVRCYMKTFVGEASLRVDSDEDAAENAKGTSTLARPFNTTRIV
jgi:hypothetical protein